MLVFFLTLIYACYVRKRIHVVRIQELGKTGFYFITRMEQHVKKI